jgi:hypothetical protein
MDEEAPVDRFELRIGRVDVTTEQDETWAPEIVKMMKDAGFSMKGGVYVWLSLHHPENEELCMMGYAAVARRTKPKKREPENGAEAGMPEFMDHCCFHTKAGGTIGWGAGVVNSLIAANYGKLPNKWLESGMSNLKTPSISH